MIDGKLNNKFDMGVKGLTFCTDAVIAVCVIIIT